MIIRCLKHRYESHESAVFARRKLYRANRRNKSRVGELNVFYCETCEAWHVGHTKGWEKSQHRR